ncbi:MAG: helix-turn-helix domain-containing protein, partial [Candidatus Dormibacteraeota bacterium]|nr:helix-turn-helix domain-containing protein [Candidatus Dormibacteraeota bacterium]
KPIGSFQAIKHKLADMYTRNQLARSNAWYAAWALDVSPTELPLAAAAARVAAELGLGAESPRVFSLPHVYAYAAMRSNPEALARSREAILGRLDGHPALLETLRAYVASNRSVSATAAAVHRHRQSVIYRLRRIAELLEVSLDDAEVMFRLEAAVRSVPTDPGTG